MNIGIFDTGLGGELVAARISQAYPEHNYTVINDRDNLPYGTKSNQDIIRLTDAAIQPLLTDCKVIIIACNTATAVAIDSLRQRYRDHRFVGFEPMLKPSSELSASKVVTILATQATRASSRYQHLKNQFASDVKVIEPDTNDWASLIENDKIKDIDLSETIRSVHDNGSDIVALACTHYLALQEILTDILPEHVQVIEPTTAVIKQLERVMKTEPVQHQ